MEFELQITVEGYGSEPVNGELFLKGFMTTYPEGGPSVSQNLVDGTLSVRFCVEADDPEQALATAIEIFGRGASASTLPPTQVVGFEGHAVRQDHRELLPA